MHGSIGLKVSANSSAKKSAQLDDVTGGELGSQSRSNFEKRYFRLAK